MNNFMQDGDFYIGANYWASHASINMWSEWDAEAVEKDFQSLSSYGVHYLRMFLVWPDFQPLKAIMANEILYEYRMMPGEKPLPDTEAGRAGVSEEACEHFAEFCKLAEKYDMKLIVGILTGHMSFRFYSPAAFEGKNFLVDPATIKWEIRFVRYFVKRFRNEKSIVAWDLGNECSNMQNTMTDPDQGYVWMQCITSAIRESDPTRPVVSGFAECPLDHEKFNVREVGEEVDVLTTHPYQIFSETSKDPYDSLRAEIEPAFRSTLYEDLGKKPSFVEETGSIGYMNCSEKAEARGIRASLISTWAHKQRGFFWWCAFDQGHLDYAPYDWNNYGSDYGYFRKDRSAKPVVEEAKKFFDFLKEFPYAKLPDLKREAVCIVPRLVENSRPILQNTFILAKQAGFDLRFEHAEEKMPESKLYIMPSVEVNKPMFLHRLNELLEQVKSGASFYFSMGDTLFRRIPELTGLTIESREEVESIIVTDKNGKEWKIPSKWRYNIEEVADSCEVLAKDEKGNPVFVCNHYGKGKIFFLTFPLEEIVSRIPAVFKEDAPNYADFYAPLYQEVGDRILKTNEKEVLTTEHLISENHALICVINYSNIDKNLPISVSNGWKIINTFRGNIQDNTLCIPACDGIILELKK